MILRVLRSWLGSRDAATVVVGGALIRIAVFLAAMVIPIRNEVGGRISALDVQTSTDFEFYLLTVQKYFIGEGSILADVALYYETFAASASFSPPLFPFLLYVSGYAESQTVPLSIGYLLLGILFVALWVPWLRRKGLAWPSLSLFVLLPNSIWFSISVSTDLLFAVIVAGFFLSYVDREPGRRRSLVWMMCLALALLTRTNSISLFAFLFLDQVYISLRGGRLANLLNVRLAIVLLIGLVAMIFYLPSLDGFVATDKRVELFGNAVSAFQSGLFEAMPRLLDLALSWIALAGAKLLYLVGLRPSFSDVSLEIVVLRSFAGLFLLPGLVFMVFKAPRREVAFVALFILPLLLGPAQDRYILPVQAILFLYGVKWYVFMKEWGLSRAHALRSPSVR